jgi:hypothetical protein
MDAKQRLDDVDGQIRNEATRWRYLEGRSTYLIAEQTNHQQTRTVRRIE